MPRSRSRPRGLLIAAEGPDASGKTALLEYLGRWLERRGRAVSTVSWAPSRVVRRAAATSRGRVTLSPRVAALLEAADAARQMEGMIQRPLAKGEMILADRYVWTAIAREVARGLDPDWAASLYRFAPRPDLILYHRQDAAIALERALASRAPTTRAEAVAAAFGDFLDRLLDAFDGLVSAAVEADARPWPVPVVVLGVDSLDPTFPPPAVRATIRSLLDEQAMRVVLNDGTFGGPHG